VITPLGDSARAASLFPGSTFVVVRNVGHVTALADYAGCAAGMVRRFLRTLSPGDVRCAERTAEIHVVPEFPRRTRAAPAAKRRPRSRDRSTPAARRGAWAAAWTVGDALARWWLMSGSEGHGLRGGTFTTTGAYLSHAPVRFELRRVRFVPDLAVSGTIEWNRRASRVGARLKLDGAVTGRLRLRWRTDEVRAAAFMTGTLDGRPVRLRTPAP
jgi:hypothetical protein